MTLAIDSSETTTTSGWVGVGCRGGREGEGEEGMHGQFSLFGNQVLPLNLA